MPGWLVTTQGALTVALDIEITPALKAEGNARELINRIQNLRKDSGFDVTDRITTTVFAEGAAAEAIGAALGNYSDYIASQTLSRSVSLKGAAEAPASAASVEWEDGTIQISVNKL